MTSFSKWCGAGVFVLSMMGAAQAQAFSSSDNLIDAAILGDTSRCTYILYVDPTRSDAEVVLSVNDGTPQQYAGNQVWLRGDRGSPTTAITAAQLAKCFTGAVAADITDLAQRGADADSFAAQQTMGFSFTYNSLDYQFRIGSGSLSGPFATIGDLTIAEGDTATTSNFVTITLSGPAPAGGATVDFATMDATAVVDSDYRRTNRTVSFLEGETTKTVMIPIYGDLEVEAHETIALALSNPTGTGIGIADGTGVLTLTNDDQATVTIADVTVSEDTGIATATIVSDSLVDGGFSVDVSTRDGTATVADADYAGISSATEVFAGNVSEAQTLDITIGIDAKLEPDETFDLIMSNVIAGSVDASDIIISDIGTVTINNDDMGVSASVNDPSVAEGASGGTTLQFTVTLSNGAPAGAATVDFGTSDGTAAAGADYTAISGTLTFASGEMSKTVDVTVLGDTAPELNETVTLTLSNPTGTNVVIADATGTGTITNDDVPTLTVADASVSENGVTARLTARLNGPIDLPVMFNWATVNGTATGGEDFTTLTGQVATIESGETDVMLVIPLIDDAVEEMTEQFTVAFSNVTNATAPAGPTTVTIVANDLFSPTVSITSPLPVQTRQFTLDINFSENVNGFVVDDLVVSNGVASNLQAQSDTYYTVDITAAESGAVMVALPGGAVTDDFDFDNVAASFSFDADAVAPAVMLSAPDDPNAGPFALLIIATEDITGLELGDLVVTGGTAANLTGSGDSYRVDITPDANGAVTVILPAGAISDLAGNPSETDATFSSGSPETEFAAKQDAIIGVIETDVQLRLNNALRANVGMMNRSMDRFIANKADPEAAARQIPLDITGTAAASDQNGFATRGTIFGQSEMANGVMRTATGQFHITHDDSESWTADISGRVTYDKDVSATTRLGGFIGASVGQGEIEGDFEGDTSSIGIIVGGFGLRQLSQNLFSEAYVGLGYTQTDLAFADDTLALDGEYDALSYYAGAGVTGSIIMASGIEIRPEVAIDYGQTEIGVVGLQAEAFGLTSEISQDFGSLSILLLSVTPEVIIPVDPARISVAPRFVCQQTSATADAEECGGGVAFAFDQTSSDGRSRYGVKLDYQDTGTAQTTGAGFYFETQF